MSDHETPVPQDQRSIQTGDLREPIPGMEVCDFCGTAGIDWSFPARRVVIPMLGFGSDDDWGACGPCHDLIVADDRQGLLARSVEGFRRNAPSEGWNITDAEIAECRATFKAIHAGFFAARSGDPTRT